MNRKSGPEASEEKFREFSSNLLAAEAIGFRGDCPFYSPDALRLILQGFCNIIATNLHAQSCTVQLKLYDSSSSSLLKQLFEGQTSKKMKFRSDRMRVLWDKFSESYRKRWKDAVGGNGKFREELLKNSIIFPYSLYPKGSAWLVASNKESPWAECTGWLVNELDRGVTTQIVQDKSARVRDRMTIRKTRSHRKFGALDPYIWTNQPFETEDGDTKSPLYFFNYYGVPIRIHQGGDVIGILRVENKGLSASSPSIHDLLDTVLNIQLGGDSADGLAKRLHQVFLSCVEQLRTGGFEPSSVSLLSLAYLAYDLTSIRRSDQALLVRDVCTLPYDMQGGVPATGAAARAFAPPLDTVSRPPVQMTFDSFEEEYMFVNWLSDERTPQTDIHRLDTVMEFYATLIDSLKEPSREAVDEQISKAVLKAIRRVRSARGIKLSIKRAGADLSLLREVRLEVPNKYRFLFHVQVNPSQSEVSHVEQLRTRWGLSKKDAEHYRAVNSRKSGLSPDQWELHIPTDRIAARIQALTFAFPIPEFTINDAWWLSWAALEIGKLIERQISYRGTNLSPTVPLTAMDFFRVPISDLSFVDELRSQYKAAEAVKNMLQYYIPNHCHELELDAKLEYHYRIKDFRSYLERLGQEHRAHYDALISIWLYILYLRLGEGVENDLDASLKLHRERCLSSHYIHEDMVGHFSSLEQCEALYEQATALVKELKNFYEAIKKVCGDESDLFNQGEIEWLRRKGDVVLGDLKFSAPNVKLADTERARELVLKNLSQSPQAASKDISSQISNKDINEYVFRRYDPFVTQCISLYILFTNLENLKQDGKFYEDFYEKARRLIHSLRTKFQSSHQLHEQYQMARGIIEAKKISDTKMLIDALESLRAKIISLSTSNFCSVLASSPDLPSPGKNADNVYLTTRGVYKRVRTLVNIASNQISPQLLNWEVSRFDYVGARINCLFKNQVFAIYEHLWNRGDPFSHWTLGKHQVREPKGGWPPPEDEKSRQRWLSIRTKIHEGKSGYNAWQISALMDPRAVDKDHWSDSIYNIRALRNYLVLAFGEWHCAEADKYHEQSAKRMGWQTEYCAWFRYIRKVLRGQPPTRETDQEIYFPEYLFRTPFDIFIQILETDSARPGDFEDIINHLLEFINGCGGKGTPARLWSVAKKIYSKARQFVEAQYTDTEIKKALMGQLQVLDKEEERFRTHKNKWPDMGAFKEPVLARRLRDIQQVLRSPSKEVWRKGLQHILIRLQSMQKQYLFDIGESRDSHNVLDRILCYVLLFDPGLGRSDGGNLFQKWSAYDLFYYLVSLVPVEIQIRTALADTMAEQYHGVYKASADPLSNVAVQRWRLEEIGRKLDDLDRETEVQYEGYIVHSMLHDEGADT